MHDVGHMGMAKGKTHPAKGAIFWPNMLSKKEDMVSNCPTCLQLRTSQTNFRKASGKMVPQIYFRLLMNTISSHSTTTADTLSWREYSAPHVWQ